MYRTGNRCSTSSGLDSAKESLARSFMVMIIGRWFRTAPSNATVQYYCHTAIQPIERAHARANPTSSPLETEGSEIEGTEIECTAWSIPTRWLPFTDSRAGTGTLSLLVSSQTGTRGEGALELEGIEIESTACSDPTRWLPFTGGGAGTPSLLVSSQPGARGERARPDGRTADLARRTDGALQRMAVHPRRLRHPADVRLARHRPRLEAAASVARVA